MSLTKNSLHRKEPLLSKIITEEMRYRQKVCEYALKYGVTKAARRYHIYRQFVYRQLERDDGTAGSLSFRSRRPKTSPNAHREEELCLIRRMLRRNGVYGLAEVYVRCRSNGYSRCFESMCCQIRKKGYRNPQAHHKSYTRYEGLEGKFPGDRCR